MAEIVSFSQQADHRGAVPGRRHHGGASLSELIALARRRSSEGRNELGSRIADFLLGGTELSPVERELVDDILSQLIREIEINVRQELAEALAEHDQAPPNVIRLLANDEIEIARPILLNSAILTDADLLDVANRLSENHRQAIAGRANLSETLSDALVEFGERPVIVTLLKNQTARMTDEALAYLVATSKQVKDFQEPLLGRADLPPKLAYRMFWWVSAALRRHLLENFDVPPAMIDGALARMNPPKNGETMLARAAHLFKGQGRNGGLGLHDLIGYMQEGRAALFIAAMAEILVISADTARRLVLDPGGEGLSLICRASSIPPQIFRRLLEALDENLGMTPRSATEIAQMVGTYENISVEQALRTIKYFDAEALSRAG